MNADKDIVKDELIALIILQEKLSNTMGEVEKLLKMKGKKRYALQRELLECKSSMDRVMRILHWSFTPRMGRSVLKVKKNPRLNQWLSTGTFIYSIF